MTRTRLLAVALGLTVAGSMLAPAHAAPTISHGTIEGHGNIPIAYTLFLPDGASPQNTVPVVFMTHGWGGTRTRTVGGMVQTLTTAGYAVLTWDARGFGDSGGEANVDSQEFEVRDVQKLIDFVATKPGITLDQTGDPRMGMIGGSYAGGIQLMTASADQRIDAIVPQIAWNYLPRALKPGGVLKLGWDLLLYGSGLAAATGDGLDAQPEPQTGAYAPQIHQSFVEGTALNDWSATTAAWFDSKSPRNYINGATLPDKTIAGVHAPALLIQGANDTLFPINDAIDNYNQIKANAVDAKMIFFCGNLTTSVVAHSLAVGSSCPTAPNAGALVNSAVLAWFDKYLRGGTSNTGAAIDYQTQDGTFSSISALPTGTVTGSDGGTIANAVAPTGGSHIVGSSSPDGFRVPVPVTDGSTMLGVPSATLSVSGVGSEAYVFLRLLDVGPDGRTVVVDDQVTAQKVTGIGYEQDLTLDLYGVSWKVLPGHDIFLEVSSTSNDHSSSRTPFIANVDVSVSVPVL